MGAVPGAEYRQPRPRGLLEYLDALEDALGRKAERNYLPMQPGDVPATFADTTLLTEWTGHKPGTPIRIGIQRFVDWYVSQYPAHVSAESARS